MTDNIKKNNESAGTEPCVWDVNVTRIGYGYNSVRVTGPSNEKDAIAQADEEVGDLEFTDRSSEYVFPDGAELVSGTADDVESDEVDLSGYLHNSSYCPHCKSENLATTGSEADDIYSIKSIKCDDCGSSWNDVYTLTDISDFVKGGG